MGIANDTEWYTPRTNVPTLQHHAPALCVGTPVPRKKLAKAFPWCSITDRSHHHWLSRSTYKSCGHQKKTSREIQGLKHNPGGTKLDTGCFTQKFTMLNSVLMQQEYHVVPFSSVQFIWISQPRKCCIPNTEEVFMQVLGPIGGWHHHWTHLSYHKWHCSNLFFWKGKGHTNLHQENQRGVGFNPRQCLN